MEREREKECDKREGGSERDRKERERTSVEGASSILMSFLCKCVPAEKEPRAAARRS